MKKIAISLTLFLLFASLCYGQNIIVNQYNNVGNNPSNNNSDVEQICGIPVSKDIGGVEMQTEYAGGYFRGESGCPWKTIVFTNYNSVPVTVLYEFYDERDGAKTCQSIVLGKNETKSTSKIVAPSDIRMIVLQNGVKDANSIAGVEASRESTGGYYQGDPYMPWAVFNFKNYNSFAVTVSYNLYDSRNGDTSGSVVLQPGETKTSNKYVAPTKFTMKVRKLN